MQVSGWRSFYQEAVSGVNQYPRDYWTFLMQEAEAAIFLRIQELSGSPGHTKERDDLTDAVHMMRHMQVVILDFPELCTAV